MGATTAPVTVLITRRVRRGRSQEFERLMAGMQAAAAAFAGRMGGFLIHPEQSQEGCYRTLFAFDTEAHLQDWTHSRERHRWLRRIAAVTHGDTAMRVLTGPETWFALPRSRAAMPPPRWKMAIATWTGIYPLVLLTSYTVLPLLSHVLPVPLAALLVTGLITVAMTWLVMPTLARLAAAWLYPPAIESQRLPEPGLEDT